MYNKLALIAAMALAGAGITSAEPLDRSLMVGRRGVALNAPGK